MLALPSPSHNAWCIRPRTNNLCFVMCAGQVKTATQLSRASNSAAVSLRLAGMNDLALLRKWDEMPQVQAADPLSDWQWETELARTVPWREQLIAKAGNRPIGFVQIIDPALEDDHYWGDCPPNQRAIDIWIGEPDYLGQGYGSEMMRQAIARCFAPPQVTAILIDPLARNVRARRFYARFGFKLLEYRWFGPDYCAVHRLARCIWDKRNQSKQH